jgi:hypothetical protein
MSLHWKSYSEAEVATGRCGISASGTGKDVVHIREEENGLGGIVSRYAPSMPVLEIEHAYAVSREVMLVVDCCDASVPCKSASTKAGLCSGDLLDSAEHIMAMLGRCKEGGN